jgi:hypothetical protein
MISLSYFIVAVLAVLIFMKLYVSAERRYNRLIYKEAILKRAALTVLSACDCNCEKKSAILFVKGLLENSDDIVALNEMLQNRRL